jgi:thymidylate synthase (FAD)
MKVSLKSITPDAEINIVEIARVSSSRQDKTEKLEGLINYLIKNKHWSPFEHSYMTIEIETSKAIGIQLLRHRSFTFQELSQRYARVEDYEDIELRKQAVSNRQSSEEVFDPKIWMDDNVVGWEADAGNMVQLHMQQTFKLYEALLKAGVAKECARMVLPMATKTTIYMTGSIRSWIHFLDIRDEAHAQKEIQLIAKEIKKLFKEQLPIISNALGY